jgi:pimeloyl-ACP methyl ester carboxylesterase
MARAAAGPNDDVIDVRKGRRVGYAVFGDPDGTPVVNCHGGLVSRNDCAPADDIARELGLRIISPDRPGIGLTDRLPGHDIVSWARTDLRDLVDALGLERFSVMGWSAGGQHALAAAHVLGERIDRVAIVAGCLPIDDPANRSQLSALDQRLLRWTDKAVPAAKAYFRMTHLLATRAPKRLVKMSAGELEGDESGALAEHAAWFAQTMAEGSHDAAGQVDDYRAFGAPWGFGPEDIGVPALIHHGTKDALVPVAWADELGRRIPNARVTTYPGAGHLLAVTHAREILESLVAP